MRDKGFSEPDVSLDKLLKFGRTLEATEKNGEMQARAMSLGHEQPRSQTSMQSGSRYPDQAACNELQQHFRRKTYGARTAKGKIKPKEGVDKDKNRNNKVCPGCGGIHNLSNEVNISNVYVYLSILSLIIGICTIYVILLIKHV